MNTMNKRSVVTFFSLAILLCVQACGGSGGGGDSTSTTFEGTLEGTIAGTNDIDGQSGTMSVTVQAAVAESTLFSWIKAAYAQTASTVTGTLNLAGGSTIDISGTYDADTGTLTLTGDGGYTFTGTIDNNLMSGDYTSTGADTGGGFAGLDATTDMVQVFCGTFLNGSEGSSGLFNLVVTDSVVSGVRINYTSRHTYRTLSGTRTGDTINAVVDANGRRGSGLITGDSIEGTFENKEGNLGTFSGSVSECQ